LALPHPSDDFVLGGNGLGRREEAASLMSASFDGDKFA